MIAKFEMKKFNGSNFLLWKMKIWATLRKNNCLEAIEERHVEITNDKWNKMDGNIIIDPLTLADGVLSNVAKENDSNGYMEYSYKIIWGQVATQ